VVHPEALEAAEKYAAQLDRSLPGAVAGFYLVGSTALGAFRPRRSDIDFVAVLDVPVDGSLLRKLRAQHLRSGFHTAARAVHAHRCPLTGTCNGLYVRRGDLASPVTEITPVASQVGHSFRVAEAGSDLSPVGWKVLAERGIALEPGQPRSLLEALGITGRAGSAGALRPPPSVVDCVGSSRATPSALHHCNGRGGLQGGRR
jgi:hypothetical protein